MICPSCQGKTQPTFEGPNEWCPGCGSLLWTIRDEVHQTSAPRYWDDYSMDGEIFSMIRETLVAVGCLHDAEHGGNTPPMMFNDWIRCAVAKREQRIRELQSQLPNGMEECTIVFKACSKGHGWLTATNWEQHPCPYCTIDELQNEVRKLEREIEESYDF